MKEKLFDLISQALNGLGLRVLRLKLFNNKRGKFLDLIIDKVNYEKVTLSDCVVATKQISCEMKINGISSEEYAINISSPGIDRPLIELKDYVNFIGNNVLVLAANCGNIGSKKKIYGKLENVIGDDIFIKLNVNNDSSILNLKLCDIIECRLDISRHLEKKQAKPRGRNFKSNV